MSDPTAARRPPHELGYASGAEFGRPGSVTALGVLSIVVASLGALYNLWGVLGSVTMLVATSALQAAPAAPVPVPPVTPTTARAVSVAAPATTGPAMTVAGQALAPADVAAIVDGLDSVEPLTADERDRFAAALVQAELPFAPPPPGGWTADVAAAAVNGSTVTPLSGDEREVFFYLTTTATLQVTPTEVSISNFGSSSGPTTTVVSASGAVTQTGMFGPGGMMSAYSSTPAIALLGVQAANILLAGVLLAAGILAVRGSAKARPFHQRWALARIATALAGAGLTFWMMREMFGGFGPMFGGGVTATGYAGVYAGVYAGFGLLISLAYPIAVLNVLRVGPVRRYFDHEPAA